MKTVMTTLATLAAMTTAAAAGSAITDQTYYGGKFGEPVPPQVTDDCRIPIYSERTGKVLYYNRADESCWSIPEDGDGGPVIVTTTKPEPPQCDWERPDRDKGKGHHKGKSRHKGDRHDKGKSRDRGKGNASWNNGRGGNDGKGGKDRSDNGRGNGKGRR